MNKIGVLLKECKRACGIYIIGSGNSGSKGLSYFPYDDYYGIKVGKEILETAGYFQICNKTELVENIISEDFDDGEVIHEGFYLDKFKGRIYFQVTINDVVFTDPFDINEDTFMREGVFEKSAFVRSRFVFTDLNDVEIFPEINIQEGEAIVKSLKTSIYFAKKNS